MTTGPGGGIASAWAEDARRLLRREGGRGGAARERVIGVLAAEPCAVTAAAIASRLPQVGRASVYRALEQLEAVGLVQRLDLNEGAARYERIGARGEHHHHLLCRSCGDVEAFDDEALEQAIGAVARGSRFEVTSHEVTLQGTCPACAGGRSSPGAAGG